MKRLIHVARIHHTPVFVHWSVLLIGGVFLLAAFPNPWPSLAALVSYIGILLVHELGHVVVARRFGCASRSVELYPIHGLTRIDPPPTAFAQAAIAWGGVVAQVFVGAPLVGWLIISGYTPFEPLNAMLAVLGCLNLMIAFLNLMPVAPLDGATAWNIIPILWRALRAKPAPARGRSKSSRSKPESKPVERIM